MTIENKRLTFILMGIMVLLLIPFIAMYFSNEVNWEIGDFVMASILLSGLGLGLEFILRTFKKRKQRLIFFATLLFIVFVVWIELAVGIFGSPLAGN